MAQADRDPGSTSLLNPAAAARARAIFQEVFSECQRMANDWNHSVSAPLEQVTLRVENLSSSFSYPGSLCFQLVKRMGERVASLSTVCALQDAPVVNETLQRRLCGSAAITVDLSWGIIFGGRQSVSYLLDETGLPSPHRDNAAPTAGDIAKTVFERAAAMSPWLQRLRVYDALAEILLECRKGVERFNLCVAEAAHRLVVSNLYSLGPEIETFWVMTSTGARPTLLSRSGDSEIEVSMPRNHPHDPRRTILYVVGTDGLIRQLAERETVRTQVSGVEFVAGKFSLPKRPALKIVDHFLPGDVSPASIADVALHFATEPLTSRQEVVM